MRPLMINHRKSDEKKKGEDADESFSP
jgi:hypothetical protein